MRYRWTYLLTYLLTPRYTVLLEKLTGLQLVKKFPAFHGTWRFINALTSVRQLSLSWASPIQSIYPHPTSCRSILILSTHLRLDLPSGLLPSGFPSKTLYTPLSSPIRIDGHTTTVKYVGCIKQTTLKEIPLSARWHLRWGDINPLKAELNPIFHSLALLRAHHILHISRIRVNLSTTDVQPNYTQTQFVPHREYSRLSLQRPIGSSCTRE